MTESASFKAAGVIPACLLPFTSDFEIDRKAFLSHLNDVAGVDGVTAVTVNGHASEVSSCTFDEQKALLILSAETLENRLPIINGVFTDSTLEAQKIAKTSEREGASALLVFPPSLFSKGVQLKGEVALTHYKAIADVCDLPIIAFQYPVAGGAGYTIDTLLALADQVPTLIAIKDYCGDPAYHERTVRALHSAPRRISVLTTHSSWLLQSLAIGCDGILSGSGSVVANLQVALWQAFEIGDLQLAREIAGQIYHWTRTVYIPPDFDSHLRMKVALTLLGKLPNAVVRPPLSQLSEVEIGAIGNGLRAAGLLSANE